MNKEVKTDSASIFVSKNFLEGRNMTILASDWKCESGSIDIVAMDDNQLVFVEVKPMLQAGESFSKGVATSTERDHLETMATEYLIANEFSDIAFRFDTLELKALGKSRVMVRHHVNALGVAS